jgi:hypothetical protein
MRNVKIALKEGWRLQKRFRYVHLSELCLEDRELVRSGELYRILGHALEDCWLYPVRADGRLLRRVRRVRIDLNPRKKRKVELLAGAEASAYVARSKKGSWESWTYSGKREIKLSKGYYIKERFPDLRSQLLSAFGATESPATPLGVAWLPPGAYDKSHFHDVDVLVVALSKREGFGGLEIKSRGRWVGVPYDIGEAVLIPKYVEHRVKPTPIDRYTATVSILN